MAILFAAVATALGFAVALIAARAVLDLLLAWAFGRGRP